MYEQFRAEVANGLLSSSVPDADKILNILDQVSKNYEINKNKEQMILRQRDLPDSAKMYLVVRKMQGFSEQTLRTYKFILEKFFSDVGKLPTEIKSTDIRLWLYSYQERTRISMRSLENYRAIIAAFFSWATNEGYLEKNPSKNVDEIKFEVKPREALTQMELEVLRSNCKDIRELAIFETLYSTGCRVSELVGASKGDINWDQKTIHLKGKGNKHRQSYLNARAEFAIRSYLSTREDEDEHLFVSSVKPNKGLTKDAIEKIFRSLSARSFGASGRRVTPHILRHTTATVALQRGMPIADIQKLLGHSNINTTMIYASASDENIKAEHLKYVV